MSEKLRTLNLTTGNVLGTTNSSSTGTVTGCSLIGAPTLISSTFSGSATHTLTPGSCGIGVELSPNAQTVGSDAESSSDFAPGVIMAQLNFHLLADGAGGLSGSSIGDVNSIMNTSQISATSNDSSQYAHSPGPLGAVGVVGGKPSSNSKHLNAQSVAGKSCRFPKLEECAHFHYERVQLGPLSVRLVDDKSELLTSSIASQSIGGDIASNQANTASTNAGPPSFRAFSPFNCWFIIKVFPYRCDPFLVKRSFDNMKMFDEMLHRCVYDRKISGLRNLNELDFKTEEDVEYAVAKYFERFSKIASDSLTCGTILTWLQLDNKGRRLPLADDDTMRSINTPAVGAAYGVRRYQAQASDEISIEVGDMISVIDMPSPAESIWWRGKKSHLQKSQYEVGFFPQSCVATIGDKVPRHFPMPAPLVGQLDVSPTKPVLRKHGKLIAFFRSFILSRPSRRRLKQSGIYRERVFSCDLSEHLLNSGQEIPMVLKCCAEFIEEYGIVDGIYRLSGITSNIQRLRRAFDEERVPDLGNPEMKQDIHAVSSLLKMYFRELPNPLCTYQLYDNFVEAIQAKSESTDRLRLMKETVLKLPPPHYRTLKYLSEHLNSISQHSARTGMTDKNLAIVWAPNLLRSPALESGGVAALRGVGVQAVVTEYLIRNCHNIFDALDDPNVRLSYIATAGATPASETRMDSLTDCESLLVEQREHDQSLTFVERPKSLSASGPKLISLEEAQERHSRLDSVDLKQSMPISMITSNTANIGSYIEVGGGPSSLPDKYHTVLSVPRSWQKRKTHSWKSLFTRNQRQVGNGTHDIKEGSGEGGNNNSPPHHKEATQVTFADTDAIIMSGVGGSGKVGKSLLRSEKTKSTELFGSGRVHGSECSKPMEVCVRSSSIDSLRTAGHSRSVSHDSYFDLLQSPQRGHLSTCASRELSELGLNFDREEPEMRIFSESESLVSSPRVGKENIPPSSAMASRRIMRARPEEFSSQTNSVNPSPKKQPRLNLLLSPRAASNGQPHNWSHSNNTEENIDGCHEHAHLSSDESCCKRYKLEDQLSDIQFIDCSTPEHAIANAATMYASVQVHAPPKTNLSKNSLYGSTESAASKQHEPLKNGNIKNKACTSSPVAAVNNNNNNNSTRYSYPTVQLGGKRKEKENSPSKIKERFSYPGLGVNNNDRRHTQKSATRMQLEKESEIMHNLQNARNMPFNNSPHSSPKLLQHHTASGIMPIALPELLRPRNRNSFCGGTNEQMNSILLRSSSNSTEFSRDAKNDSKICVTPSTPIQSPRYSLLLGGDTSSENSSAVTTPQYDLDPLMVASAISGLSAVSGTSSNQQQQFLLSVDASSSFLGTSPESLASNLTSHSNITTEKRDMNALKRELSLELQNPLSTKMNFDQVDTVSSHHHHQHHNNNNSKQQQMLASPSNNSNVTDNTSQSVTPSEFGYQNLHRPTSMHSLIETEENSPAYDDYENAPSNLLSPLNSQKLGSPIKSTISITYNLKSPKDEIPKSFPPLPPPMLREKPKPKTLLETSFDENIVYEQVKIFRNSVTEVNQLLNDNRKSAVVVHENMLRCGNDVINEHENEYAEKQNANYVEAEEEEEGEEADENDEEFLLCNEHDIQMCETNQNNLLDGFETDKLLYQNIELRKPKSVYENMLGEDMKTGGNLIKQHAQEKSNSKLSQQNLVVEKLEELLPVTVEQLNQESTVRKSPSNFSVKELATKFESSPVETTAGFDFSFRSSLKKNTVVPTALATVEKPVIQQLQQQQQQQQPQRLSLQTNEVNKVVTMGTTTTGNTNCNTNANSNSHANPHASANTHSSNQSNAHNNSNPTIKQKLTKTQQITRSLDENAFIREFGAKHLHDFNEARSTQQLPELFEVCNRRKSFDFTRPKTLNPPKRLPGMAITEEICMKSGEKPPIKYEHYHHKEKNYNHTLHADSSIENDFESSELKITPTTENRISLIQNNVPVNDLNNSNANVQNSTLKVLSGVKLDRERIDKIKEERRQQLTQKYRTESFKSQSKTDLNVIKDDDKFCTESLRVKSKSRGDMRSLQKDIDNIKEFGRAVGSAGIHAGSESTLNTTLNAFMPHRVRSISDEKNQNCDTTTTATSTTNATQIINNSNATNAAVSINNAEIKKPPEEFSARATAQKFERKNLDFVNGGHVGIGGGSVSVNVGVVTGVLGSGRERSRCDTTTSANNILLSTSRTNLSSTREKISPQFSIRDVTAMFESRSQNQQ